MAFLTSCKERRKEKERQFPQCLLWSWDYNILQKKFYNGGTVNFVWKCRSTILWVMIMICFVVVWRDTTVFWSRYVMCKWHEHNMTESPDGYNIWCLLSVFHVFALEITSVQAADIFGAVGVQLCPVGTGMGFSFLAFAVEHCWICLLYGRSKWGCWRLVWYLCTPTFYLLFSVGNKIAH